MAQHTFKKQQNSYNQISANLIFDNYINVAKSKISITNVNIEEHNLKFLNFFVITLLILSCSLLSDEQ